MKHLHSYFSLYRSAQLFLIQLNLLQNMLLPVYVKYFEIYKDNKILSYIDNEKHIHHNQTF